MRWICTTPGKRWHQRPLPRTRRAREATLALAGTRHQAIDGFGGCFNELGWEALGLLSAGDRAKVIAALFDPRAGCRFNYCRLPVGANDYALEWYSLNEHDGDYAMRRFSIARDQGILIPYIRTALAHRPDLRLFASPWSPPTWMKHPRAHNYGTMVQERRVLDAYALYFAKFVEAYAKAGVDVHEIHVQNEPVADQKFPSCLWTGREMRDFIRDHLGPTLAKRGLGTEVWLGTLNSGDYNAFANIVLSDPKARRYVAGVSYQWAGKLAIQQTHEAWPGLKLMQSENECGDGANTWDYARYVFDLVRHYLSNGANAYVYWNMVLQPEGRSTWGWKQNAMVTVDPKTRRATLNPEFYVMKHLSAFVDPGAVRLGLRGEHTGNALAFANPDGSTVVVVSNPLDEPAPFVFGDAGGFACELPARSFSTFAD